MFACNFRCVLNKFCAQQHELAQSVVSSSYAVLMPYLFLLISRNFFFIAVNPTVSHNFSLSMSTDMYSTTGARSLYYKYKNERIIIYCYCCNRHTDINQLQDKMTFKEWNILKGCKFT